VGERPLLEEEKKAEKKYQFNLIKND